MMSFLIAGLLLAALYLFLIAPSCRRPHDSRLRGWLYAHRGLHDGNKNVMENSMAAFELAVEKGYGIELDVQLTRDNRLVVYHDASLKRLCGVDRRICHMDWASLPPLPDGSRIPLLTEVLGMVDGRAPLMVELKRGGGAARVARAAHRELETYHGPYCVESFNPIALRYFRRHAPHILRGQLSVGGAWRKSNLNPLSHFALKYLLPNALSRPHFVACSVPEDRSLSMWLMKHVFRLPLACWTVRDQQTLDYARREGYRYPIFECFEPKR